VSRVRPRKALLGFLVAYLTMPFDLVPDFIPVAGQLDDAVLAALVAAVRPARRGAGPDPRALAGAARVARSDAAPGRGPLAARTFNGRDQLRDPRGLVRSFFEGDQQVLLEPRRGALGPLILALLCYGTYLTIRSRASYHVLRAAYPTEDFRWREIWGRVPRGLWGERS